MGKVMKCGCYWDSVTATINQPEDSFLVHCANHARVDVPSMIKALEEILHLAEQEPFDSPKDVAWIAKKELEKLND